MIGLMDCNNFFVSCERIFDLSLVGKPVAVLSNNDGCVISRSNELKALGVPMGMPMFELSALPFSRSIRMRSSNYELYGDISRRVMCALTEFVPSIEQYSVDEAFLHPELPPDADFFALGRNIRRSILQWIGVPVGVGFAPTKTLAKIANHIGKKRPEGVFVLPPDPSGVLANIPVGEVWGVGRRLVDRLVRRGIRTALDLARSDETDLRSRFHVGLARTALELRGVPCIEEIGDDEPSQSITYSRSFGHPVTLLSDLEESIAFYLSRAAEKLRREGQKAAGANLYFQYYPEYEPYAKPGGVSSATATFRRPTDDTVEMLKAAAPLLKGLFLPGRRYKKSGVTFFGLERETMEQPDLFSSAGSDSESPPEVANPARDGLFQAIDRINAKFGKGSVFLLSEGIKKTWTMKRSMLSGRYTTDWDSIPRVR